jgi:hypothetical protein
MQGKVKKKTKKELASLKLATLLEVGDSFSMEDAVIEMYNNYDFYLRRSYDVHLAAAKKMFPDRTFRTIQGQLTRIT